MACKAILFTDQNKLGNVIEKKFIIHKGGGASVKIISNNNKKDGKVDVSALTDLCSGQLLERGDKYWKRFDNDFDLELTFNTPIDVNSITIQSLRHTLQKLYAPYRIEIFSKENGTWNKIGDSGFFN